MTFQLLALRNFQCWTPRCAFASSQSSFSSLMKPSPRRLYRLTYRLKVNSLAQTALRRLTSNTCVKSWHTSVLTVVHLGLLSVARLSTVSWWGFSMRTFADQSSKLQLRLWTKSSFVRRTRRWRCACMNQEILSQTSSSSWLSLLICMRSMQV